MGDWFYATLVIMLGIVALGVACRGLDRRREVPLLATAYLMHVGAAFAQVWITRGYYGGGDAMQYHRQAQVLARLVRAAPSRFLPELWALFIQGEPQFPVHLVGVGAATGTQHAVSTVLCLALGGSFYAMCLALGVVSFVGTRALYQVFRDRFEPALHPRLLLATMALPSVVFWTSGVTKEASATAAFCVMVYALHLFSQRRRALALLIFVPSLVLTTLLKGYVVAAFFVAGGALLYWSRALGRGRLQIRPIYLVAVVGLALAGLVFFGRLFPRYSFEGGVEEVERLQMLGTRVAGGSNYALRLSSDGTVASQLLIAPYALLTALFRPLPFEVSGAAALVNSFETASVLLWFLHTLYRHRIRDIVAIVRGSPILVFSVVFVLLFGVGVGVASTNLGTLSRYRVPMMPLVAATLVVLHARRDIFSSASPPPRRSPAAARAR